MSPVLSHLRTPLAIHDYSSWGLGHFSTRHRQAP